MVESLAGIERFLTDEGKTMDALRIACVGLGGWGKNVARVASQVRRANLAAICDADTEKLKKTAPFYPFSKSLMDYGEVLDSSEIDAVLLATPVPSHFALAMKALEAGKHVYVEKPMTLTVEEGEALVRKAEETGRILMAGHLLEYHPAVNQLKQLIEGGELGEIRYLYTQRLNLGVVRRDENALWSLAPHDISVILYLLGCEPETISATGLATLQPGVEDVVFVSLLFPNKRMAQIHVSWLDPNKERKLIVVGSQKMAVFDDMHPSEKIRIYDKGANIEWSKADVIEAISVRHGNIVIPVVKTDEPLTLEIQHFIDCALDGKAPRSDGKDGLRVVRVLESAAKSLKQNGAPVSFR